MSRHAAWSAVVTALVVGTGCRTGPPEPSPVWKPDPLRPILTWRPFPSQDDLVTDRQGRLRDATDVSYDLEIFARDDGRLVYSRSGLSHPSHQVDVPLPADQVFHWTVRPRFLIDGKLRVGSWRGDEPRHVTQGGWRVPPGLSNFASFVTQ